MIRVSTVDGSQYDIDAAAWHVDDTQGLHLKDTRKNPVASFAPTKWIAVEKIGE